MPKSRIKNEPLMNHLLAALPEEELARLNPSLESVSLTLGEVIYESCQLLEYIYFPTTAIISLLWLKVSRGQQCFIGFLTIIVFIKFIVIFYSRFLARFRP